MSLTRWTSATAVALVLGLLGGGAYLAHCPPAARQALAPPAALPDGKRPAPAVDLRWKFEKGKPFYQVMTIQTHQTMIVMNNIVKQAQKQTFYFRWTPLRQAGADWVLQPTVEGVKMDIDIGGNNIRFDSTREKEASNPLAAWCKSLVGAQFQVTLDDEGNVREVERGDALRRKLAAATPAMAGVIDQALGNAGLRQMAEQSLAGLPDEPVRPGDRWTRRNRLDLGPAGEYKVRLQYTYQGREGKLDRIRVESTLKGQPFAGSDTNLAFQVKKGTITGQGTGTLLFDRARGRIVHKEWNWTVEGKLTVAIGGQETEVSLTQTQSTKVETSDSPLFPQTQAPEAERKEIERLREENERLREDNERLRRRLQAVEEALRRDGKPKE